MSKRGSEISNKGGTCWVAQRYRMPNGEVCGEAEEGMIWWDYEECRRAIWGVADPVMQRFDADQVAANRHLEHRDMFPKQLGGCANRKDSRKDKQRQRFREQQAGGSDDEADMKQEE